MLGDKPVIATIAVNGLEKARIFYENVLGLTRSETDDPGGILYKSGDTQILVYSSESAGTNKATSASWTVGNDIETVIKDLESKGVAFEQYDNLPNATREGSVHIIGNMKAAWFKDPDGNILNIVNTM
jgi:catechol 2,3-dioxygenase-like lactoylglutathione lyase family enzyme